MKKYLAAGLLSGTLLLGGCAGTLPTLNLANTVNLNTIEGVVSGYGILANQELLLMSQPLCKTGTAPSVTNVCVKRSQKIAIQTFDKNANSAINTAVAFIKANPTVDPTSYITAASQALTALQTILNTAKGS